MPDRKLRIGIVGATPGTGWGPRAHIPSYKALPDLELTAVCTAHRETAEAAAKEFGVPEVYTDYHEMVRSPNVDVVSVVTRILLHHPISRAALEAGKHVFCEWPLGANLLEAEDLAALAKQRGLRTVVGLQSRFAPPFMRMKELLEEGYLGRPLSFHLSMILSGALQPRPSSHAFTYQREAGAGALAIAGGHAIEAMCWLLGDFETLAAQVATQVTEHVLPDTGERVQVTAPDNVSVVGRLRNGAVGTVQISNTATRPSGLRLEVHGTDGKLTASSAGMIELSLVRLSGSQGREPEAEIAIPERLQWVPGIGMDSPAYNIAQLFVRWAEGIRADRDVSPTFDDAVRVHRLLDAIERASETRSWVTV